MAELLTHVLVAGSIGVVLSWWVRWITPPMIAAAMVGAAVPDLNRIGLFVPDQAVESLFGVTWSWTAVHRAGGTLVVVAIIALLVPWRHAVPVFAMVLFGAASHYLLDVFLWKPTGLTSPLLWPFTDDRLAVDGFYLSTDRWTAALSLALSVAVVLIDRHLAARNVPAGAALGEGSD